MMCAKGESPRLLEGSPHDEGISSPYHRLMWAADARQGSLPMPRFSLMQAAPAGSRVIPDRPSDKDHEEGKGKSSDTWGQKWARFDTLRLPSWCFHSGIFWAFESYHCLCMIIPPFLTILLQPTSPAKLFASYHTSSCIESVMLIERSKESFYAPQRIVSQYTTVYIAMAEETQWISMKPIWCGLVTRYFWFGALAGKFVCRTGRAHSWGGHLGWFSTWKISMESSDTTAFQLGSNTATTEFGLISSWSSWFGLGLCATDWKNSIPATSAFSLPERICCIFVSSCFVFCLLFQVQDHGRNWMAGRTSAGGSRHLGTDGELQDF